MPLLAQHLPIGLQHLVDVIFTGASFGRLAYGLPLLWWDRAGDHLAHHFPVHSLFLRQ